MEKNLKLPFMLLMVVLLLAACGKDKEGDTANAQEEKPFKLTGEEKPVGGGTFDEKGLINKISDVTLDVYQDGDRVEVYWSPSSRTSTSLGKVKLYRSVAEDGKWIENGKKLEEYSKANFKELVGRTIIYKKDNEKSILTFDTFGKDGKVASSVEIEGDFAYKGLATDGREIVIVGNHSNDFMFTLYYIDDLENPISVKDNTGNIEGWVELDYLYNDEKKELLVSYDGISMPIDIETGDPFYDSNGQPIINKELGYDILAGTGEYTFNVSHDGTSGTHHFFLSNTEDNALIGEVYVEKIDSQILWASDVTFTKKDISLWVPLTFEGRPAIQLYRFNKY